jgi:hypothetical protein
MFPRHVRLGFFLLFSLGCGVSGCADPFEPEATAEDGTPSADAFVAAQVRPQTPEEKKIEVGRKLLLVQPGMTRQQVEELLGPPGREDWRQISDCWDMQPDGSYKKVTFPYVVYYCSPPNLPPGSYLMSVGYRSEALKPIPMDAQVIDVTGPHYPGSE